MVREPVRSFIFVRVLDFGGRFLGLFVIGGARVVRGEVDGFVLPGRATGPTFLRLEGRGRLGGFVFLCAFNRFAVRD